LIKQPAYQLFIQLYQSYLQETWLMGGKW